jgi:beta-galactosidase
MDRRKFLGNALLVPIPVLAMSRPASRLLSSGQKPQPTSPPPIELGVDYYAEDWPTERTEIDARLMQAAGIRVVRLIDTNWERTEPSDGHHEFAWLDRVIEILAAQDIRSVLGTSSYVPPAWLMKKHPEFYAVNKDGVRYRWGGMGWVCFNNPQFRAYVSRHVTALAEHYGTNPAVIGWQIDNELGVFGYFCYDTDYCLPKFQQRLKHQFGTIEHLNQRLATVSYGHAYSSFDQVPLNWTLGSQAHQAPLELEAQRFFSSNVTDHLAYQAAILRRFTRQQWITHNSTGPNRNGNLFDFAKPLDFMSYDGYAHMPDFVKAAFAADFMRGVNHGRSYLALEMRSGYMGPYTLTEPITPDGLVRLWGWQTLARGARGLLFFRWRMAVGGSEQYWQGLLDYDGRPNRAYKEIARIGNDLKAVGSVLTDAATVSPVAQMMSYDSLWALHIDKATFPYFDQMEMLNRGFRRCGINVDVVPPDAELSSYKVVLAPTLHVVSQDIVSRLESFVSAGGVLVITARSGFKTPDNLGVEMELPGLLRKLVGARIPEFTMLAESSQSSAEGAINLAETGTYLPTIGNEITGTTDGWKGNYKASVWADLLEPEGASVLFQYTKDFYAGRGAVTMSKYGKGTVVYIGTILEPSFYLDLSRRCCDWAGVVEGPAIPEGVDYAVRHGATGDTRFILNFTTSSEEIAMPGKYRDLIKGDRFHDKCTVGPLDLLILVRDVA